MRKKNEWKNNTGLKLVIRNKNKYESKPLISDPRFKILEDEESVYEDEEEVELEGDNQYDEIAEGDEEKTFDSDDNDDIGKEFYSPVD